MSQIMNKDHWQVARSNGRCAACQTELPAGTSCWAVLMERPKTPPVEGQPVPTSPYERLDYCEKCWGAGQRPAAEAGEVISFWKTVIPEPTAKKKLFVDDSVLIDLFQRLEDKTEGQEIRFRFVLALILMRKRILRYDGMEERKVVVAQVSPAPAVDGATPATAEPPEVWLMTLRRSEKEGREEKAVKIINPQLTAEQISEVSGQLSQILAEEI